MLVLSPRGCASSKSKILEAPRLISLLPPLSLSPSPPPLSSSARVRIYVFLTSMANSVLQLVIDKGPRRGETVDCQPGSAPIRIGRVVRGNTFAIKDPGISQKHLLLQFLSPAPGWALTDLDTSNGTLLNGVPLPPSRPVPVSTGDTIKIGETTSMKVNIVADLEAEKGRPRRAGPSSRRKGEASEPVAEEKRGRGRRAGTRADRATVPVKEEILETIAEDGGDIQTREEGRVGIPDEAGVSEPGEERSLGRRRGRGRGRGRGRRVGAGARSRLARVSKEEEEEEEAVSEVAEGVSRIDLEEKSEMVVVGSGDGVEAGVGLEDDMEKMTLREWFDRMENFLPQVIRDASEEIIASLRERTRKLEEFIVDGSNAAG